MVFFRIKIIVRLPLGPPRDMLTPKDQTWVRMLQFHLQKWLISLISRVLPVSLLTLLKMGQLSARSMSRRYRSTWSLRITRSIINSWRLVPILTKEIWARVRVDGSSDPPRGHSWIGSIPPTLKRFSNVSQIGCSIWNRWARTSSVLMALLPLDMNSLVLLSTQIMIGSVAVHTIKEITHPDPFLLIQWCLVSEEARIKKFMKVNSCHNNQEEMSR